MNRKPGSNPDIIHLQRASVFPVDRIATWYSRIVAIYVIVHGVVYWNILVGITGEAGGISTMPFEKAVLVCALSVGLPIAGAGLWLLGPWGAVLWLALTILQAGMIYFGILSAGIDVFIVALDGILIIGYYILSLLRGRLSKSSKFNGIY